MKEMHFIFYVIFSVLFLSCSSDDNNNNKGDDTPEKGNIAYFGTNLSSAEFAPVEDYPYGEDGYHYSFPSTADIDYFQSKGLKLIRLPFRWERVQPELNGPIGGANYLKQMKDLINHAQKKGVYIILDMHNFGRRPVNGTSFVIGQQQSLKIEHFADVWKKLAAEFKDYHNIWGYDLMNEPHDMGSKDLWFRIAQSGINAIREVDTKTAIIISGDNWSSASAWVSSSDNLKNIIDPFNKLIYQAHIYFDKNSSGVYAKMVNGVEVPTTYKEEEATPQTGVNRIKPFIDWLKQNKKIGFIGELGIPNDDAQWNVVLENTLKYMVEEGVPGTYWSAGPRWGDYRLSIQPLNNYGTDRPQMSVLKKYTKTNLPIYK